MGRIPFASCLLTWDKTHVSKQPAPKEPNAFQSRVINRLAALGRDPFEAARIGQFSDRRFVYDITILRKRSVQGSNLDKLAKALDWSVPEVTGHKATVAAADLPLPDVTLPRPGEEKLISLPPIGNRDVPILGIAIAGDDADFTFNGEVVDRAPRPAGLLNTKDAFALYVPTDSMYPAFRSGEVFFINPNRQATIGDDVVVELFPEGDGNAAGKGFLKRLKSRTASKIVVEQFNPPMDIEFDRKRVKALHRVVPWQEAMGL